MNYKDIKNRVFKIIQASEDNDIASRVFDICLIGLILINVCLVIADTFNLPESLQKISYNIEVVSVIIFSIEYILRIWTADYLYPNNKWFIDKVKYIF